MELWLPRAEAVMDLIFGTTTTCHARVGLKGADVIALQEFWFEPDWLALLKTRLRGTPYELVAARREGTHPHDGSRRSDGVATLVKTSEFLSLVAGREKIVRFADGRVALVVAARLSDPLGTTIAVANVHLPYPSSTRASADQVAHVTAVADAVDVFRPDLGVVCGDFNCLAGDPAATALEARGFMNCAAVHARASLISGVGGRVDAGVTHKTHDGRELGCDHVFAKEYYYYPKNSALNNKGGSSSSSSSSSQSPPSTPGRRRQTQPPARALVGDLWARDLGYFDRARAAVADVDSEKDAHSAGSTTKWDPAFAVSDHLPVTAVFEFTDAGDPRPDETGATASCGRPDDDDDDDDDWRPTPWTLW